jgi:succinylglutamic semialdehyde dehydrogenase
MMINLTGELLIDGLWLVGHGDEFESLHPVTDETIWDGSAAGIEDVDAAVRAARKSFRTWRNTRFDERLGIVKAFGELLEANKEALATLIGVTLRQHSVTSC